VRRDGGRVAAVALAAALWAGPAAGGAGEEAAAPLPVVEVAPGVFVHRGPPEEFAPGNGGGIANLAFVVGGRGVAVIDSGGSLRQGRALLAAIRARTALPVSHVVNTHLHPDHVLGNGAFPGAEVVGHAKLAGRLAENGPYYLASLRRLVGPAAMAGTEIVPPTRGVADTAELDLGGRVLRLRAWPTAHTDTDLTVLDSATGTLFAGDLLFMERIPVVDGSLLGWLRAMEELERLPAGRVVPGHGPPSAGWPVSLGPQRAYLEHLRDSVRAELRRNRTLEQAVDEVPLPAGSAWLLAGENHARNVTASFAELEWE
jgi:quinoprotein relay system zinc metallohydrolase 2